MTKNTTIARRRSAAVTTNAVKQYSKRRKGVNWAHNLLEKVGKRNGKTSKVCGRVQD